MKPQNTMQLIRILRLKQVKIITGMSCSTIYRLMALNQFPRQIKLTKQAVGWNESDIQEWLQSRIANSPKTYPV